MRVAGFDEMLKDFEHGVYDYTKDGKCTGCGQCCARLLPVTRKEVNQIHRYIEKHNIGIQEHGTMVFSKQMLDCICPFLDMTKSENKCAIYEVRPTVCRDFICNKGRVPGVELMKIIDDLDIVDFTKEFYGNN